MVISGQANGGVILYTGFSPLTNIFETNPFCHAYTVLPVNKKLRQFERIKFIANSSSIYTKSVCHTSTRTYGEVGGESPLQLSSQTHFDLIEDKKSYCGKLVLKT